MWAAVHVYIVQLGVILLKIICLLIAIAYYTIAERKVMAAIQRRRGPNVVGFWGLLQPLADGLKLLAKELIIPGRANRRIFVLAPMAVLVFGLTTWGVIPFALYDYSERISATTLARALLHTAAMLPAFDRPGLLVELNDIADLRYGLLFILATSSLTVYGIIIAGWSSNSKYAFLGALRSAAQMIAYEVSISLTLLPVIALAGSTNLTEIVAAQGRTVWFIFPLLPVALIFFISMIAETNRTPFDLPEAEAELVAGYNVEYSSITFAMFFLAEYGNMILASLLFALLFLGGWLGPLLPAPLLLVSKGLIFCFLFILVRATLPRYRYDQLMDIGWKVFLPLTTGYLLLTVGILFTFDAAPLVFELLPPNSPAGFLADEDGVYSPAFGELLTADIDRLIDDLSRPKVPPAYDDDFFDVGAFCYA